MSFLKSISIGDGTTTTEFSAQDSSDVLMPKENPTDPDVTVADKVSEIETALSQMAPEDLTQLATTEKGSLVGAVNEVFKNGGAISPKQFSHVPVTDNNRWSVTLNIGGQPILSADGTSLGTKASGVSYFYCPIIETPDYMLAKFGDTTMNGAGAKFSALPTNVYGLYVTPTIDSIATQLSFGGGQTIVSPSIKSSIKSASLAKSYQNYSFPLELVYLPPVSATETGNYKAPAASPVLSYWDNTNKTGTQGTVEIDIDKSWFRMLPIEFSDTSHSTYLSYRIMFKTPIPKLGCVGALTPNNWYFKIPHWAHPKFIYS